MILRPLVVLASLMLITTIVVEAQTGSVTGHVVKEGKPTFAIVSIQGDRSLGELTDSSGAFRINGVPPGSHVILAESIGHDPDVAFVNLAPGASAEVTLELRQATIPLSGADYKLPRPSLRLQAALVIPELLRDSVAAALLGQAVSTKSQAILVWAPWTALDTTITVEGKKVHVTGTCDSCAASSNFSLEGGKVYTAGVRHVLLGLTGRGSGEQLLTFCLSLVQVGKAAFSNCASSKHHLTYARRPDGEWLRLQLH